MSTKSIQTGLQQALPKVEGMRVAVVSTLWNSEVTDRLRQGALDVFNTEGFKSEQVKTFQVPGAVELTFAASQLIESEAFDAVIVLGCVIRGGTPHFDYVCQSVTQGITALNADCDTPVIFGVLTVDTLDDALDRAGGPLGNKGAEAAEAAIRMVDFRMKVADL
ncbi:MAG: 6,7-dimethyl-8-ribityllumazine synthase [Muribaculaceae bacterium]|nr:6,7-dimethyl-8-ribityllumazine synthase [Muribaculaceae bacterium]MDE6331877.1 6,7-dimethyl-8-ribityllumazine synthase [Muribaculaceae bacterium]